MEEIFDNKHEKSYSAKDIEVLEGLDPVRKRPGMYIGGTGDDALHHLVTEVLDNSMDEAVAGFATRIELELNKDGYVSITDNGRGIPVDPHPKFPNKSALEVILTTLHSGGKFSDKVYQTSGGLHGVGVSVVNALSSHLIVEVAKDKEVFKQEFSRGIAQSKLEKIGTTANRRGTKISFLPDIEIFKQGVAFKPHKLYKFAKSKAFLYKGVEIRWKCDPELLAKLNNEIPESEIIHFPNGLEDYLDISLKNEQTIIDKPFSGGVDFSDQIGRVEWSISWTAYRDSTILSYCNTVVTPLGGTHESGLRSALVKGLKDFGELLGNKKASQITADDVFSSIFAVLSLFMHDPQFQGQTKEKLVSKEATKIVEGSIKDYFDHWLSQNKEQSKQLLEFIILQSEERLKKKKSKDLSRKSITQKLRLPGKLADCTRSTKRDTEIFIVEGDSAGGSAKMARDRETQAILPLRGKVLNVASATVDKIKNNQEINDLNLALGCGEKEHYSEDALRYDKVIIMTDADVDGSHICSLLMTYFFWAMPKLIEKGHLYLACPPLFRITQTNKSYYASSAEEKDAIMNKLSSKGKIDITRFKGLGEMTPSQLKETTMNKENRRLVRISFGEEGYVSAKKIVSDLMGKKPELRFQYISEKTEVMGSELVGKLDV